MRLSRLALSLLWFPVALSATTSGCGIVRVPIGDLDPDQQPLDPDGSGAGGAGGPGGSSSRCGAPVASHPFSLDDWAATSGTSPLAITGIAFDPSGNLGMTGYTVSDVDMPGSSEYDDALLAKYDAAGNHTLSKLFGDDSNPQAGRHIVFDADCNMFLVRWRSTSSWFDMFLDKLDSAGNPLWSKRLNAGHQADWNIRSIAVDPATGGVVFMGRYYGDLDLGGGLLPRIENDYDPTSGYVAKLDAMGHFVWSKFSPRGSGRYTPGAIMAVDTSGQIVLAADDSDIVEDGSGKLARFLLARLDASGNDLWSQELTAPLHHGSASDSQQGLAGVAVDGDGSVILAGNAHCDFDFGGGPLVGANCSSDNAFVAKFDVRGGHLWSRLIEGSLASRAVSLGVDALGNTFVAGSVTGTLDADGTALGAEDEPERQFVVRLDRDGHISWHHILSLEISRVQGLAVDPEGNVAIVGQDASAVNSTGWGGNIVTKLDVAAP
ncbi:hypothetical protein [Sorangium sp. So ce145]|uniref:Secreted protein n=1 Tax=Sorangium cellulosum (strain So ce56) TaxID=448385 RepID=A9FCL2_SORC5|nr:hypothetical protein sce1516 [Sorangium cellulosum So ce56]